MRIVVVASGKGGTGKTTLAINLGLSLAESGGKVGLLDACVALPCVDLAMGIERGKGFEAGVPGDPVEFGEYGLLVWAESAWAESRTEIEPAKALEAVKSGLDWLVVDCPTGHPSATEQWVALATDVVAMACPEASSLIGALSVVRTATSSGAEAWAFLNLTEGRRQTQSAWRQFEAASGRFLSARPLRLGEAGRDPAVAECTRARVPAILRKPKSTFVSAIASGRTLLSEHVSSEPMSLELLHGGKSSVEEPVAA